MRDGVITFSDLAGRLEVLRVECERCGRHGRYPVAKLIAEHGGDAKLIEWFSRVTSDCSQKNERGVVRACDAIMPDLSALGL
jgi:hypothetical protein